MGYLGRLLRGSWPEYLVKILVSYLLIFADQWAFWMLWALVAPFGVVLTLLYDVMNGAGSGLSVAQSLELAALLDLPHTSLSRAQRTRLRELLR